MKIIIKNKNKYPLGINAWGCGSNGILIQKVKKNGAINKDGRIKAGDFIMSINNFSLRGLDPGDISSTIEQSMEAMSDEKSLLISYIPARNLPNSLNKEINANKLIDESPWKFKMQKFKSQKMQTEDMKFQFCLRNRNYTEEEKILAIPILYSSKRCYNLLRRKKLLNLPHPRTIQKWVEAFRCSPGFSREIFGLLKMKLAELDDDCKDVSLCFDEIKLREGMSTKYFLYY